MGTPAPPLETRDELALLGALLVDPWCLDDVASVVGPEDFGTARGRAIYCAALFLLGRDGTWNFVALATELERRGLLPKVVPTSWLTTVAACCPTSLHALLHAKNVARDAREWRAREAAEAGMVEPSPAGSGIPLG